MCRRLFSVIVASTLDKTGIFKFSPVSCESEHIRHIISSIASNKSTGIKKVSMSVIADSFPFIFLPLTEVINQPLAISTFPKVWKIAELSDPLRRRPRNTINQPPTFPPSRREKYLIAFHQATSKKEEWSINPRKPSVSWWTTRNGWSKVCHRTDYPRSFKGFWHHKPPDPVRKIGHFDAFTSAVNALKAIPLRGRSVFVYLRHQNFHLCFSQTC